VSLFCATEMAALLLLMLLLLKGMFVWGRKCPADIHCSQSRAGKASAVGDDKIWELLLGSGEL